MVEIYSSSLIQNRSFQQQSQEHMNAHQQSSSNYTDETMSDAIFHINQAINFQPMCPELSSELQALDCFSKTVWVLSTSLITTNLIYLISVIYPWLSFIDNEKDTKAKMIVSVVSLALLTFYAILQLYVQLSVQSKLEGHREQSCKCCGVTFIIFRFIVLVLCFAQMAGLCCQKRSEGDLEEPFRYFVLARGFIPILFIPSIRRIVKSFGLSFKSPLTPVMLIIALLYPLYAIAGIPIVTDSLKFDRKVFFKLIRVLTLGLQVDSNPQNNDFKDNENQVSFIIYLYLFIFFQFVILIIAVYQMWVSFSEYMKDGDLELESFSKDQGFKAFKILCKIDRQCTISKQTLSKALSKLLNRDKLKTIDEVLTIVKEDLQYCDRVTLNQFYKVIEHFKKSSKSQPSRISGCDCCSKINSKKKKIALYFLQILAFLLVVLSVILPTFAIDDQSTIQLLDWIINGIFCIQILLRFLIMGSYEFVNDNWNIIDVVIQLIDTPLAFLVTTSYSSLRIIFQLSRIIKLFKVVTRSRFLSQLRFLLECMARIIASLVPYIYSIMIFFYWFSLISSFAMSSTSLDPNLNTLGRYMMLMIRMMLHSDWSTNAVEISNHRGNPIPILSMFCFMASMSKLCYIFLIFLMFSLAKTLNKSFDRQANKNIENKKKEVANNRKRRLRLLNSHSYNPNSIESLTLRTQYIDDQLWNILFQYRSQKEQTHIQVPRPSYQLQQLEIRRQDLIPSSGFKNETLMVQLQSKMICQEEERPPDWNQKDWIKQIAQQNLLNIAFSMQRKTFLQKPILHPSIQTKFKHQISVKEIIKQQIGMKKFQATEKAEWIRFLKQINQLTHKQYKQMSQKAHQQFQHDISSPEFEDRWDYQSIEEVNRLQFQQKKHFNPDLCHLYKPPTKQLLTAASQLQYCLSQLLMTLNSEKFFQSLNVLEQQMSTIQLRDGSLVRFLYQIKHSGHWISINYHGPNSFQDLQVHFLKMGVPFYDPSMRSEEIHYIQDVFKVSRDDQKLQSYARKTYEMFEGLSFGKYDVTANFVKDNPQTHKYDLYFTSIEVNQHEQQRYQRGAIEISRIMMIALSKEQRRERGLNYSLTDLIPAEKQHVDDENDSQEQQQKPENEDEDETEISVDKVRRVLVENIKPKIMALERLPDEHLLTFLKTTVNTVQVNLKGFVHQVERVLNCKPRVRREIQAHQDS